MNTLIAIGTAAAAVLLVGCSPSSDARRISGIDGAAERTLSPDLSDYVRTPAGLYHRTCIYEVPVGGRVEKSGAIIQVDGTSRPVLPCAYPIYPTHREPPTRNSVSPGQSNAIATATAGITPPTTNGWIESEWIHSDSGMTFTWISASVRVPQAPANAYGSGKVYYAFPGLEPENTSYIVQPVIQYGNNNGFGGNYWTMATWLCGSTTNCYHSPPTTIYAGDSVYMYVFMNQQVGQFQTSMHDVTRNTNAGYTWGGSDELTWAQAGVVETYGLTTCADYPGTGVTFQGIGVFEYYGQLTPSGSWADHIPSTTTPWCNYGISWSGNNITLSHF